MKTLGTVITYCTNDYRFISKCIEEAKVFSSEIIVVVCDHFFDGSLENRALLEHTYALHPDCKFIEFSYLPDRLYSPYHKMGPTDLDWACFWAATTRYIGLQYLSSHLDYALFIDCDEIADGKRFLEWFDRGFEEKAMRLGAYYYALTPWTRSETIVSVPLLVEKKDFAPLTLLNGLERIGAYVAHPGPKNEYIVGLDGKPFFHHYSWVREKAECLQKGQTWGHKNDKNWTKIIEKTFASSTKKLFDSPLQFETVDTTYFNPLDVEIPKEFLQSDQSHVTKINDKDLFRKEIENALI